MGVYINRAIERLLNTRAFHVDRMESIMHRATSVGILGLGVKVVDSLAAQRWSVDAIDMVLEQLQDIPQHKVSAGPRYDFITESAAKDLIGFSQSKADSIHPAYKKALFDAHTVLVDSRRFKDRIAL